MTSTLPRRRKHQRTKPLPERVRCPGHLAWVRGHECAVIGRRGHKCGGPMQAAHARVGTDGAGSVKPGDNWTIPLCAIAHQHQHFLGETSFEQTFGIDMKRIAAALWDRSPHKIKWEMKQRESA